MGGYGALRIGMDHPDVFTAAYGMSPCCVMGDDSDFREDVVLAQRAKNLKEVVAADLGRNLPTRSRRRSPQTCTIRLLAWTGPLTGRVIP